MKNILTSPQLRSKQKGIFFRITIIIIAFLLFLVFLPLHSILNFTIILAGAGSDSSIPEPLPLTPFEEGKSLFLQGEYKQAIPYFEAMLFQNPNHTESYYYLGQCYLQQGIIEYNNKNFFKATSLFRKANEIAEQVIPLYEKGISEDPNNLDNYMKLGYIYEVRSQVPFNDEYKIALEYYLKGLAAVERLESNLISNHTNSASTTPRYNPYRGIKIYFNSRIGYIFWLKKDYAQAIDYLEQAADLSPQNIEVNYYLGLSYAKIEEKEKAQHCLSMVIELAPQSELAREAEKELKKIN